MVPQVISESRRPNLPRNLPENSPSCSIEASDSSFLESSQSTQLAKRTSDSPCHCNSLGNKSSSCAFSELGWLSNGTTDPPADAACRIRLHHACQASRHLSGTSASAA